MKESLQNEPWFLSSPHSHGPHVTSASPTTPGLCFPVWEMDSEIISAGPMQEAQACTQLLFQALYWDVTLSAPAIFSLQLVEFPASKGDLEASGPR